MWNFWQLLTTLYPHPAEPPPAITVEGNVTTSPGSHAVLTCHIVSTVNFNLTWLRGGHDARLDPRVHVLTNLSLQVSSVTPDQSGWYECIAINEGGVTAERIYLTVEGEECVLYLGLIWCCGDRKCGNNLLLVFKNLERTSTSKSWGYQATVECDICVCVCFPHGACVYLLDTRKHRWE